MMLIDKSHDMPEKIFDEILKRARYLGGVRRMIAIEGLEMPENCSGCDLCRGHICKITGTDIVINPKGNCPLVEDVVEREKIDKAIKIAKDTISECFELGLDDRAYGMREILNIFEENIGERIEILHKLKKE